MYISNRYQHQILTSTMASIDRVKVTVPVWDSDKDPKGFRKWSRVLTGMVKSCKGGTELENFKDQKMGVVTKTSKVLPSYISNDPDFGGDAPAQPDARRQIFSPGDIGPPSRENAIHLGEDDDMRSQLLI